MIVASNRFNSSQDRDGRSRPASLVGGYLAFGHANRCQSSWEEDPLRPISWRLSTLAGVATSLPALADICPFSSFAIFLAHPTCSCRPGAARAAARFRLWLHKEPCWARPFLGASGGCRCAAAAGSADLRAIAGFATCKFQSGINYLLTNFVHSCF